MTQTFIETWNATFEAAPADNENINLGASRIRNLKVDIRQRLAVDHSWIGDGNDGKHSQVQLRLLTADPVLDPTDGALYTKVVNGNTELFFEDSSARVVQCTSVGALNPPQAIPSGTVMLFAQSTAPVGWVQDTSKNDVLCYVTNNAAVAGGSLAGATWAISGLSGSTSVIGHVLNQGELPPHTHNVLATTAVGGNVGFQAGNQIFLAQGTIISDGGTVSGLAHSHPASTSVGQDGTWRPPVLGVIVCRKQ